MKRLALKFRQQQAFASGYSPLYARLFGQVAAWLEVQAAGMDPLVAWLIETARDRRSLEVTLLLAAGLHRAVLAGTPEAANLAGYYPSAGGQQPFSTLEFTAALRQAIMDCRDRLEIFIRSATVQTNETGRGLCWLLPVLAVGWQSVHLVDLGASAGLNLLAEQRAYRLVDEGTGGLLLDAGLARPVQFVTRCRGLIRPLANLTGRTPPEIVSRSGCDIAPFPLATRDDELTLMAFIWSDQVNRLARLKEGITAYRQAQESAAPVKLFRANLPGDLPHFLGENVPAEPSCPVVVTNTWMSQYLPDRGRSLFDHLDLWAGRQGRPVLWLQWEPPLDGSEPPENGWCAWTADLWSAGSHHRFQLGWVHPHGGKAIFGEGLAEWLHN